MSDLYQNLQQDLIGEKSVKRDCIRVILDEDPYYAGEHISKAIRAGEVSGSGMHLRINLVTRKWKEEKWKLMGRCLWIYDGFIVQLKVILCFEIIWSVEVTTLLDQ